MKKQFCICAFLLFSYIATFGQDYSQTFQIILKLKKENRSFRKSICFQKNTGNKKVDSISQKFHAIKIKKQSTGGKSKQYIYIILFPLKTNIQMIIDEYYNTGEIEYAEPDHIGTGGGGHGITPNDPYFFRQWGLKNDGSFPLYTSISGADIVMEDAWSIEQGDSNIVVGIIDSGIKLDHPEFTGRIWINYKEIPNNRIDDDNNGYIDDIKGWDFVNSDNNPTDDYGHGTNVAGIIGANGNNSIGYAGVDWNCKLMILKGLDNTNSGFYSWWTEAIYYSVDNGVKVINMSLGGIGTSITLQNSINYALTNNVVVVVSMGNSNSNIVQYPSGYLGVIAVGSTNSNDYRTKPFFWSNTSGSNYGSHISVVAPGNYIYGLNYQSNTNYSYYWGGTSQAAPHVTGLVSLLLAQDFLRTPVQIKSLIENTAEDQVGNPIEDIQGWDQYFGHGRINAFNALSVFTGTKSLNLQAQNFLLFPNPTNQYFTVIVPAESKKIQIYNSLGELIQVKNINGQASHNLQLVDFGIYYIQIISETQKMSQKLIVCK